MIHKHLHFSARSRFTEEPVQERAASGTEGLREDARYWRLSGTEMCLGEVSLYRVVTDDAHNHVVLYDKDENPISFGKHIDIIAITVSFTIAHLALLI